MELLEFERFVKSRVVAGGCRLLVCSFKDDRFVCWEMGSREKLLSFLQELKKDGVVTEYGVVCELSSLDKVRAEKGFKDMIVGVRDGMPKQEFMGRLVKIASLLQSSVVSVLYVAWHSKKTGTDAVFLNMDVRGGVVVWTGRKVMRGSLYAPFNIWTPVQRKIE